MNDKKIYCAISMAVTEGPWTCYTKECCIKSIAKHIAMQRATSRKLS